MIRKVRVYKNLHKNCWSVMDCKTRRVIAHRDSLVLTSVEFVILESGRQRVLDSKRKCVHAFAQGFWDDSSVSCGIVVGEQVRYNPYQAGYFVGPAGNKASGCEKLVMSGKGLHALHVYG